MRCAELRRRAAGAALVLFALSAFGASPQADGEADSAAVSAAVSAARHVKLPPPQAAGDWGAFRLQAAQRLVDAHPDSTYLGVPPEPLYGIPVLEVELRADGSVRRVRVVREPVQAKETLRLAIAAVNRAAPYGSMRSLPKPWKFREVFLFDEQLRFKPATLDR